MKETFLNNSISLISKYNDSYKEEDIEKLRYGLEGIYLTIFKLVIILVLSLILNIVKEVALLLLFYNFLRFFAFGFHAKSSNECLALSIGLFVILPLCVFKQILSISLSPIISVICLVGFLAFAPSDTVKRPLTNQGKRLFRKIASSFIALIYTLICIFSNNQLLVEVAVIALIIESIMINPITYKVYGQPYNNYKNYLSIDTSQDVQ